MLDSLACSDVYPETLYVARWLFEQSAEGRELYDRLHARREGEPPLIELAKLFFSAETGGEALARCRARCKDDIRRPPA